METLPAAYLTLMVEGRFSHSFPLRGEVKLGRDKTNGVVTADQKVSRHHATLSPVDDHTFILSDHGSANGTYINGVLISQPTRLKNNDKIRFGDTTFLFTTSPPGTEAMPFSTPKAAPVSAQVNNSHSTNKHLSPPLLNDTAPPIWLIIGCMALLIVALLLLVAMLLGIFVGRSQVGLMLWWWLG